MAIKIVLVFPLAAILTGCTAMMWVKPGASPAEFQAVLNRCDYEAALGTPDEHLGKGIGGAIASGISEGTRMGMLKHKCLVAYGWQQVPMTAGNAAVLAGGTTLSNGTTGTTQQPAPAHDWAIGYASYNTNPR